MSGTHVFTAENFDHATPVQNAFTAHYDVNDPLAALHEYTRSMHQHTQTQMERACRTPRRRGQAGAVPDMPTDASQTSDSSSVSSGFGGNTVTTGMAAQQPVMNGFRRTS